MTIAEALDLIEQELQRDISYLKPERRQQLHEAVTLLGAHLEGLDNRLEALQAQLNNLWRELS